MEYGLIFNPISFVFGCCWIHWRSVKVTKSTNWEKNQICASSVLLHLQWEVWMSSGLLTDTALTAAVKLMGSSCPPGDWELCWGLHCAWQSAGQLQRGKFKNGFGESSATQWNTVQGLATGSHILQYLPKTGEFLQISLFQHHSLCRIVRFYELSDILMIEGFILNFFVGRRNDEPFTPLQMSVYKCRLWALFLFYVFYIFF